MRRQEVTAHLKGLKHGLGHAMVVEITKAVGEWGGIDDEAESGNYASLPTVLEDPIDWLPVYDGGIHCSLVNDCPFVCPSMNTMKAHWRNRHGWQVQKRIGGTRAYEQEEIQGEVARACRRVKCQRLFASGKGSNFFRIHADDDGQRNEVSGDVVQVDDEVTVRSLLEETKQKWQRKGFRALGL